MPNLVLFFLIFGSLGFLNAHSSQSGHHHHHHHRVRGGQRIINGARVPHSKFPFVVSIQAHNVSNGEWLHGCGGSIVNAATVLTACHCVAAKILGNTISYGNQEIMRVVAGSSSLTRLAPTTQIRGVRELIASPQCSNFPQYDDGWYGHDVGFIVVKKPFAFTPEVQPMRVYSTDLHDSDAMLKRMVYLGDTCYVPGWGTTEEFKGTNSEYLLVSKVNLIPATRCRDVLCELSQAHCYSHFDAIGQVCGVSKVSSDCQGDSGGPLVCRGMVFGTVSYGERCLPGWPSVFQSIRPILELIKSRTARNERVQHGMRRNMHTSSRGIALGDDSRFKQRKALKQHEPPLVVLKLGGHRHLKSAKNHTKSKTKQVKELKNRRSRW